MNNQIITIVFLTILVITALLSNRKKVAKTYKRDRIGRFAKKAYKFYSVNDLREDNGLSRYGTGDSSYE